MPTDWIVAAHLFATFAMTGIIWFVQVVHYPMLSRLPHENFGELEREREAARGEHAFHLKSWTSTTWPIACGAASGRRAGIAPSATKEILVAATESRGKKSR